MEHMYIYIYIYIGIKLLAILTVSYMASRLTIMCWRHFYSSKNQNSNNLYIKKADNDLDVYGTFCILISIQEKKKNYQTCWSLTRCFLYCQLIQMHYI